MEGSHWLSMKEVLIELSKRGKFDVMFTDPVTPLAEHLSVPSVYFLRGIPCGLDFEATQCPNPPSYVPRIFTEHTDHMSFLQRVKNLVFDVPNLFLCNFFFQPFSRLASEFLQRDMTVLDLLSKASVWLLRLDFVLDYPRPLMPNIVLIGGVNCAHKELPQVGRALFLILILIDFVLDYPRPLMPNIILIGGVNCAHKELPQVGRAPFLLLILTDACVCKSVVLCSR
uniref:UDP-glucuronosyltransferase 1-1 n=1 Tax=Anas platyrhynchos TaxID=8839 RepID=A0A8B9ZKW9_ANAPL